MRRAPRVQGALGLGLALAALAALPVTAWGGGGHDLQFTLTATNGYRIGVEGSGATASLTTTQPGRTPRRSLAFTTYIARAKVSAASIKATFGTLGSVAVRFHPSGRVTQSKPQRACKGPNRYTIRFGVFVGVVRFSGESGYTSADAHRARGKVVSPLSLHCSRPVAKARHKHRSRGGARRETPKVTSLDAGWRSGLTAVFFRATTGRAHKARFAAATLQSVGSLAVAREAFALASPLTFAFDNALSFASISPPAPFSGTGSLQRSADGQKIWTGSLAVSFPGAPDVPLTGPQFTIQFTRS